MDNYKLCAECGDPIRYREYAVDAGEYYHWGCEPSSYTAVLLLDGPPHLLGELKKACWLRDNPMDLRIR